MIENEPEKISQTQFFEFARVIMDVGQDQIAQKLDVGLDSYRSWAQDGVKPPKKASIKMTELQHVIMKSFPYCPNEDLILGERTAGWISDQDKTCPVCGSNKCDWEFKEVPQLFSFDAIHGPNPDHYFYWIEDERIVRDVKRDKRVTDSDHKLL